MEIGDAVYIKGVESVRFVVRGKDVTNGKSRLFLTFERGANDKTAVFCNEEDAVPAENSPAGLFSEKTLSKKEVLAVAALGYPDITLTNLIAGDNPSDVGDTLALFVQLELSDVLADSGKASEQLTVAITALLRAQDDLEGVISRLMIERRKYE